MVHITSGSLTRPCQRKLLQHAKPSAPEQLLPPDGSQGQGARTVLQQPAQCQAAMGESGEEGVAAGDPPGPQEGQEGQNKAAGAAAHAAAVRSEGRSLVGSWGFPVGRADSQGAPGVGADTEPGSQAGRVGLQPAPCQLTLQLAHYQHSKPQIIRQVASCQCVGLARQCMQEEQKEDAARQMRHATTSAARPGDLSGGLGNR